MARYNKLEDYWKDICSIHLLTKHYTLLAEELSLDGNTFLQPMKEHRDAYDHIIRVISVKLGISKVSNAQDYMLNNMNKALGHEYRAFFDTADWMAMIIKERLNELLIGKKRHEIEDKFPDYPEFKQRLLDLPEKIAKIRESKDIGKNKVSIYDEINCYQDILDSLISDYKALSSLIN